MQLIFLALFASFRMALSLQYLTTALQFYKTKLTANTQNQQLNIQDEISLGRLKVSPGIRFDYTGLPNKPALSAQAPTGYTNKYFDNMTEAEIATIISLFIDETEKTDTTSTANPIKFSSSFHKIVKDIFNMADDFYIKEEKYGIISKRTIYIFRYSLSTKSTCN